MMGFGIESSPQSLDFPLLAVNGIAGRKETGNLNTTVIKAKLE
jgi:hypothetical protein